MTDSSDLLEELKRLRRGRGVQAPAIIDQIGPTLRKFCEIHDFDGAGVVREKVIHWATNLIGAFPEDLKLTVETALGINPEAQHKFYTDRLAWLAEQANRDSRTMARRTHDALVRLCEAALMPQPQPVVQPDDEWHVRRFDALLRLDGITPVCHEVRTIVADKDGIDQVTWSISLPKAAGDAPDDLHVNVLQGVVLTRKHRPSGRRHLLDLQLPESLRAGQTHEFALEVRIPRGQPMRPTYMFWPERRCELFNLVVRFASDRRPQEVWRVCDVFHRDADDIEPAADLLTVNSVGEVQATFTTLRPGRGYGIQWKF